MKEAHKLQKSSVLKCPSSKKYQEIVETIKKPPPQMEMKHMTQGRTQKHKSKEKTLQQQKQIALLRKQKYKRLKEEA